MKIKLVILISLFMFWFALAGIPHHINQFLFLLIAPLITYTLSNWLNVLPNKLSINYATLPYILWLILEIIESSFCVIKIIWQRKIKLNAGFGYIKSNQKLDVGKVMYGNSITLTPGTVTLDIKSNVLFIHALDISYISILKDGAMDKKIQSCINYDK